MKDINIELTPKQKQERAFEKTKAFVEEYEALCKKHGMQYQPFLDHSAQAIRPVCLPVDINVSSNAKDN